MGCGALGPWPAESIPDPVTGCYTHPCQRSPGHDTPASPCLTHPAPLALPDTESRPSTHRPGPTTAAPLPRSKDNTPLRCLRQTQPLPPTVRELERNRGEKSRVGGRDWKEPGGPEGSEDPGALSSCVAPCSVHWGRSPLHLEWRQRSLVLGAQAWETGALPESWHGSDKPMHHRAHLCHGASPVGELWALGRDRAALSRPTGMVACVYLDQWTFCVLLGILREGPWEHVRSSQAVEFRYQWAKETGLQNHVCIKGIGVGDLRGKAGREPSASSAFATGTS